MSIKTGRIAFRQEGEFWNAYWAETSTMNDAIHIGSIRMSIVIGNDDARQAFIDLVTKNVGEILEDMFGVDPAWTEQQAPEHERAGNA